MPATDHLTQLGRNARAPASPEEAVLETVPFARGEGTPAIVRFTCPEFTSLCPVTGQPDFAHLVIDYAPDEWLVESKSLKLFLTAFRNHGAFHEACTLEIARRMVAAARPLWLRIAGYWFPRRHSDRRLLADRGAARRGAGCPTPGCSPTEAAARNCVKTKT